MTKPALKLFGLKTCDTCKKAQRALVAAGHRVHFVCIRTEADLAKLVPDLLKAFPDKAINKSSTTWRNLPTADRARAATNPAQLLIDNPTLIKRPVIDTGSGLHLGWAKDTQSALL